MLQFDYIELPGIISTEDIDSSVRVLRKYYGARYPLPFQEITNTYSGAWFDEYAADARKDFELTSDDLVSLALLSTPIKGVSVVPLTETFRDEISDFLRMIPVDKPLWEVTENIDENWAPWTLERFLCDNIKGVSTTRASKLIARKRPHLYPINDSVVKKVLNTQNGYVAPIHRALQSERLRDFLDKSRKEAHLPDAIPLLRILDVLCWMDGKNRGL